MYPDCRRLMHSWWPVWEFMAGPPRGMPGNVGPERYYVRMRPARAREGDRPLVPTLTTARTPAATAPADAYTARHLSVLEGPEAARNPPPLHIRSTATPGPHPSLAQLL